MILKLLLLLSNKFPLTTRKNFIDSFKEFVKMIRKYEGQTMLFLFHLSFISTNSPAESYESSVLIIKLMVEQSNIFDSSFLRFSCPKSFTNPLETYLSVLLSKWSALPTHCIDVFCENGIVASTLRTEASSYE